MPRCSKGIPYSKSEERKMLAVPEKYEKAMASLTQMEKRAVMAETMLDATMQYEHGQVRAASSPRSVRPDSPREVPAKKTGLLSFGLGWRDRNKVRFILSLSINILV
ncbi:hypothetical protein U1Q18_013235 [Sarracenia purpurea var. burkii]